MDTTVKQSAADLLTFDRVLARYGPETAEIRGALKEAVGHRIDDDVAGGFIAPGRAGSVAGAEGRRDHGRRDPPPLAAERSCSARSRLARWI